MHKHAFPVATPPPGSDRTAAWPVALTVAFAGLALLIHPVGPFGGFWRPSELPRSNDHPASVLRRARPYGSHLLRSRICVPGVRLSLCAVSVLEI